MIGGIVNWEKMPKFIKEGINGFPFENMVGAQMFSDLLAARTQSLMTCAPNMEDPVKHIDSFIDEFGAEMVSSGWPEFHIGANNGFVAACQCKVCGQMLYVKLPDSIPHFLRAGIFSYEARQITICCP